MATTQGYTSLNQNTTIPPTTSTGNTGSSTDGQLYNNVLHKGKNTFLPSYCTDGTSIKTFNYQISSTGLCSGLENINSDEFTNDNICRSSWNRKLTTDDRDNNRNRIQPSAVRSMHWFNGGYFYGMEEYRKYIYEQLGTIHFSTSVKYDIKSSDTAAKIDYLNQIYLNNEYIILDAYEFGSDITYHHAPSMFLIAESFASISDTYNLDQKTVTSIYPTIKYDKSLQKFMSIFKETYTDINDCGNKICTFTDLPNGTFYSNDIAVSLSNGSYSYFPLTNDNVKTQFHHRKSFVLKDISREFPDKMYFDFITPTTKFYDDQNNCKDISNTIFNSYFITNETKAPYNFVTSSTPLNSSVEGSLYINYKFIGKFLSSGITGKPEIFIPYKLDTNPYGLTTYTNIINEFNEINSIAASEANTIGGHVILNDIINHMKTNHAELQLLITAFKIIKIFSGKMSLNKTENVLDNSLVIKSTIFNSDGLYIQLEDIEKYKDKFNELNGTGLYAFMVKCSTLLTGYSTNTTNTSVPSGTLVLDNRHYKTDGSYFSNSPMVESNKVIESNLFDINSSRFSTPDYSSIQVTDTISGLKNIPLRGSEYMDVHEKNDHPIIRYVRKTDGKFYVQILAGAFPYYHSLVHYPVVKELTDKNGETENAVIESLKKVCSKSKDWYNHVASTKWMCYIKHTEFGSDPTDYLATELTRGAPAINPPKYIGNKPINPTERYIPPSSGGGSVGPIASGGGLKADAITISDRFGGIGGNQVAYD